MGWWFWLLVQLVVVCCSAVVAFLWWLWVTRPHVDLPGPPTLPIIGNILEFHEVPLAVRKLRDFHNQYGDLMRFYMGPILVIVVAHPDDVQHILLTSKLVNRDPFSAHAVRIFLGDGLLSINDHLWKKHRKLINPTFHSELLEGFLEAFHEGGLLLSERLATTKGSATDVHPLATLAALRTLCHTIIGIDPDLLIPDGLAEQEMSAAIEDARTTFLRMMVQPWFHSKFLLRLTSASRSIFKFAQMMQDQAMQCIAMRSAETEEGPSKTRRRLLESLVKPGGQTLLPVSEIQAELMHLTLAGTETTAATVNYALALLALHPEWQDAARQELRGVFGEGDGYLRAAGLSDLAGLRVLESIIKETLRLFPVVPMIPRVAMEDIWLSKGRELVPKGTLLAVAPFLTHRLPEFFPDPLQFDPSRFLEGHSSKEHPASYLPFGLGARNCVGSQYARLQLKVFLAHVLRRFRFLPHTRWEDLDDGTLSMSLHTAKPIKVSCVPLHEPNT